MKPSPILASLAWLAAVAPTWAQSDPEAGACARARDPVRCEMRDAALKTCADLRGMDKRLCFETHMAPIECTTAQDPARCERIQQAKATCSDQLGAELRRCLREHGAPPETANKKAKKTKKPIAKPRSTTRTKPQSPTPVSSSATAR